MGMKIDTNLNKNTKKYRYNQKYKIAIEITLHFINIKELKFSYKQNGNKLARVLVAISEKRCGGYRPLN